MVSFSQVAIGTMRWRDLRGRLNPGNPSAYYSVFRFDPTTLRFGVEQAKARKMKDCFRH